MDLSNKAVEPNPLFEPDCLLPAAHHQRFGADIDLALAADDKAAYACIPIRPVRNWRGFPYPFATTQVWRTLECGTPIIDPDRGVEGLAAILSVLSGRREITRSRILVLPQLTGDGPVFQALHAAAEIAGLPCIVYESWERGLFMRRQGSDYEQRFNSAYRHQLRRRRRRLTEELGSDPRLVDRTDDPEFIGRLIELEAAGYKGTIGVAMAGHPGEPDYFTDMCRRFAAAGRLHVLSLEAGDQAVAMEIWVRGGDGLFMIKTAYDERYARCAPGVQLHLAAIEHLLSTTDAEWLDTCTWRDNETFLRLFPDRRLTASIFVPLSRNPMDRAAARSFMALRPLHRWNHDRRHAKAARAPRPRTSVATSGRPTA